ncbi:ATP-binding protein [Actinophytocola algeriensis]|uniref:histidine kinase n=1 Tax=Actinophytocola algeriensis TaxID=1768010 RepID=A0A7W7VBV9_9PSEU|nr:ATP-binding protein [Actinophytocola algeriensis]MBB4904410.1 signal transduction histidine kinase [Actinophytocola algeriensis]MBE1476732.1 signal transduction histidine kinase [Actinophytocola algeriensis]
MTVSSPVSSSPRYAGPWTCIAGVAGYVAVSPLIFRELESPIWVVVWLAVGAIAIGVVAAGAARTARAGREHIDELHRLDDENHNLAALAETRYIALETLVEHQLPSVVNGMNAPPLPDLTADDVSAHMLAAAAVHFGRLRDDQLARQDAVAAAVVALGRKVQASAHRIQEEAARMVQAHPTDPDVLHTSMRIDHAAAQQARNAQTLAALCGEWPGQQWHEPLPLADVVRGAAGRITAYQRVEVSGDPAVAVSARVVEPLIHVVAELLANATQSSPPTTQVLVTLRQVQRGAVIEIDDGGVGLDDKRLEQAREIASGRRPVGLADLGEIPQTGLPVVGAYVRRHGFRVDVTESVYGGLRAIVLVPTDLTEAVAPSGMVAAGTHALARRQERHAIAPAPREPEPEPVWELERQSGEVELPTEPDPLPPLVPASEEGELPVLPRRRSRRGHAVPQQPQVDWPAERDVEEAPEQAGQWMNAFLSGAAAANGELDLDGTEQLYQSDKHDDQPHGAENSEDLR